MRSSGRNDNACTQGMIHNKRSVHGTSNAGAYVAALPHGTETSVKFESLCTDWTVCQQPEGEDSGTGTARPVGPGFGCMVSNGGR